MVHTGDAIDSGLVASLAQPGRNITGMTYFVPELMAKRIELLKEAIPRMTQVAVLVKPDNPALMRPVLQAIRVAAGALNVGLQEFDTRGPKEFDVVFSAMVKRRVDAIVLLEDAVYVNNSRTIAELATKMRIASAGFAGFAEAGGVIGYGVSFLDMYRRAAYFIDKILKGAKPADLPVERPTKFELVINMKTGKALGIKIPNSILLRADKVME